MFKISGEFVVNKIRDLWGEGSYSKAMDLIDTIEGLSLDDKDDIIQGRKTLTGVNDLELVDDDFYPDDFEVYPTLAEALKRGDNFAELEFERESEARLLVSEFYRTSVPVSQIARKQLWNQLLHLVGEKKADDIWEEFMHNRPAETTPLLNKIENKNSTNPIEEVIFDRGFDTPLKKDNKCEGTSGWIVSNGDFYVCGFMEHIGTAAQILNKMGISYEGKCPERTGEGLGWVKIGYSSILSKICVHNTEKMTQRQKDRLFDYSIVHDLDYESLL